MKRKRREGKRGGGLRLVKVYHYKLMNKSPKSRHTDVVNHPTIHDTLEQQLSTQTGPSMIVSSPSLYRACVEADDQLIAAGR